MSNRYSGYPCTLTIGGSDIDFRQMESHSFSNGSEKSLYTPSGSVDRLNAGLQKAKPVHRWGTRDLTTVFANVSPSVGATVAHASTPGSVCGWFRYQERNCGGTFKSGTEHVDYENIGGFLKPVTLTANENDVDGALVTLELHSTSNDGLTVPDDKTDGNDYSAVATPAFTSQFFFGKTQLNGSDIEGIDGFSLDFGLNISAKLFGLVYPTCYTIDTRTPSIQFTGTNAAVDAAVNQFINGFSGGAGWVHYLRKGVSGGARVADATTQHMSFAISDGEWCVDDNSVQSTGDGTVSIRVEAINATVAVNTATAVP